MKAGTIKDHAGHARNRRGLTPAAVMVLLALPFAGAALPARLVLALDGVAYRDLQALQAGISRTNFWGGVRELRAFTAEEGYFPVSRMISTFPSASDVAWTDIFGNRPLPGYQRTYYSKAANSLIELNGVTTTVEHERQMDYQVQNGLLRGMGYMFPTHTFRYERRELVKNFWKSTHQGGCYYVYSRASDDAQHLDRDILSLLCELDRHLQKLRADYRAREGRDLEIVILSDHGHNHAGRGIRVEADTFLEKAGYHVTTSINGPKDVVLPVVGIESWVEVHCHPGARETLAQLLCRLKGVDVLAAALPGQTNRFLVMNAGGERADILWNAAGNSFRYDPINGDPLRYEAAVVALKQNHQLDADGFAGADAWLAATMTQHYPLALERIVRGLTRATLNPASILISLDDRYVNDFRLTDEGSRLVNCGSTHGGLDEVCSDGILLSNFAPTHDTSSDRVAAQFDGFPNARNFRAEEGGAELVTKAEQSLVRILRDPFDQAFRQLPGDGAYLRIWSPQLMQRDDPTPVTVTIEKARRYSTSPAGRQWTLAQPLALAESGSEERIYALPEDLKLEPRTEYYLRVRLPRAAKSGAAFGFSFRTNDSGEPVPY
ncbi:MAG: hypothetical protein ABSH48_19485 [Verrucomicrobiota bacterium]|jgi:hypothetical protein